MLSAAWEVIHENMFYPFHIEKVQTLYDGDQLLRLNMCRSILRKYEIDNNFINITLFTFTRDGVLNLHNTHQWAIENPHAYVERDRQRRFKLNVWARIIGDQLVEPHFFDGLLNGDTYLLFLQNILPGLLDDVPLQSRVGIWLRQDWSPPHFSRNVRTYYDEIFPDRWIGREADHSLGTTVPRSEPNGFFSLGSS